MAGKKKKPVKKQVGKKSAKKPERIYKINSGLRLYNKIQKQFAELNRQLPERDRLPAALRNRIISKELYPYFKGLKSRQQTISAIRTYIQNILEGTNAELCDVRLIPPSAYALIPYYELDSFIVDVLPACVDIRINAGSYGITKIFNTANYNYSASGVQAIVEKLRPLEKSEPAYPEFSGVIMVKPNRKDDNNPASYYLDMQLSLMGEAVPLPKADKSVEAKKKATSKEKLQQKKIKEAKKMIADKIAKLTKKTPKEVKKEQEEAKKPAKKTIRLTNEQKQMQAEAFMVQQTNLYIQNMQQLYQQGLISKKDMQLAMKKALDIQGTKPIVSVSPQKKAQQIPLGKPAKKTVAKKATVKKVVKKKKRK